MKQASKFRWIGVCLGVLFLLSGYALSAQEEETDPQAIPAAGPSVEDARRMLQDISWHTLSVLRSRKLSLEETPREVYQVIDELVLPHFDFPRMAKIVLDAQWQAATPEQQQRFIEEFRNLLVRTYSLALAGYSEEQIRILPVIAPADARRIKVRTVVQRSGSSLGVPIDYELYLTDGEWKVFNVIVDGFSLITSCRNDFYSEIQNEGMDKLILRMQRISESQDGGD